MSFLKRITPPRSTIANRCPQTTAPQTSGSEDEMSPVIKSQMRNIKLIRGNTAAKLHAVSKSIHCFLGDVYSTSVTCSTCKTTYFLQLVDLNASVTGCPACGIEDQPDTKQKNISSGNASKFHEVNGSNSKRNGAILAFRVSFLVTCKS